jgi:hypothetical protein
MKPTVVMTIGVALAAVLLTGCGGGASHSASPATIASTTAPPTTVPPSTTTARTAPPTTIPPTTTTTGTTGTTSTSTVLSSTQLGTLTIAAPAGYAFSPTSDDDDPVGAISPAEFDKVTGESKLSTQLGYLAGYDTTYNNTTTSESIEIVVTEFSTIVKATEFLGIATDAEVDPTEAPTSKSVPTIPGAVEIDATKPDDGFYDYIIVASKGSLVWTLDYSNDTAGPPTELANWAQQQYSRL